MATTQPPTQPPTAETRRPWREAAPLRNHPSAATMRAHYAAMSWAHYKPWRAAIDTFLKSANITPGAQDAAAGDAYRTAVATHQGPWVTAWVTAATLSGWTATSALHVAEDDQEVVEESLASWLAAAGIDPAGIAPEEATP